MAASKMRCDISGSSGSRGGPRIKLRSRFIVNQLCHGGVLILFYYREHLWSWFCRLSAAQCLCEDFPLLLSQHSHFCRCIEHLCHPVATLRESNKLIGAGRPGSSASAKLIPSQDASHDGHNFFEPIQFFTPFADAAPDKSDYTLFNPTPDADLRSFNTDRPPKANSPYTVDAGHFQYETDITVFGYGNTDGVKTQDWTVFDPTLKLGLT